MVEFNRYIAAGDLEQTKNASQRCKPAPIKKAAIWGCICRRAYRFAPCLVSRLAIAD